MSLAVPMGLRQRRLGRCAGRVLGEPVHALVDVPALAVSAMDGFAVRHDDVAARLPVVGTVPAGAAPTLELAPGCAARIMTGAPVPHGADTVVPVEDVQATADHIVVVGPVTDGQHVRHRGEDVRTGALVLPAGRTLRPADVAACT